MLSSSATVQNTRGHPAVNAWISATQLGEGIYDVWGKRGRQSISGLRGLDITSSAKRSNNTSFATPQSFENLRTLSLTLPIAPRGPPKINSMCFLSFESLQKTHCTGSRTRYILPLELASGTSSFSNAGQLDVKNDVASSVTCGMSSANVWNPALALFIEPVQVEKAVEP